MSLVIDIQRTCDEAELPAASWLRRVARLALADLEQAEVNLRLVDAEESRQLNHRYRDRDQATNVLSFPSCLPPGAGPVHLGDVVLCAPVIAAEAAAQGKSARAHWAHMVIHGLLHLRGFDHIEAVEAERMEAEETRLLAGLGIDDPYCPVAGDPAGGDTRMTTT